MPKVQSKTTIRTSRVGGTYNRAGGDSNLVAPSKNKHQCDVCHKFYSRASDLTRHERLHSDDKDIRYPFKCTQCPKRFSNKDALKPHMQSKHSTDAEYKCRTCGELHRTKSGLTHHERRHQKSRFVAQRLAGRRQRSETVSETSKSESDSLPVSSVGSPSNNFQISYHPYEPVMGTGFFASHLSPVLYENQYILNLQVDHTAFNPIQPDAYPLDLSQTYNYANEFDLSPFPEGLVFPSQVEGGLSLELDSYPYSYAEPQTSSSGSPRLFHNMTVPAVAEPQQIDAYDWDACTVQDGEPSLTDYFNSPFQFNDGVSELELSYDMFSLTLDHPVF